MSKQFICTSDQPVVTTAEGKLRGFRWGSTYAFYGVRYACARRFMMPEPESPWEGIRDALSYGYTAPLLEKGDPQGDLFSPHRFWPQSEDCLSLNIWTQSIDANAKKPVMVWLHGGAYMAGSSIEMYAYDGANLSEFGDVVVVTVNHRLNILGFLDLSQFGEAYWNSGNAGLADLVEALRWIRRNIAVFGGDPDNVTLFGQSGGAAKVHDLMQIPQADDLFARGIMDSGTSHEGDLPFGSTESCTMLARGMMEQLGLSSVEGLAQVPFSSLAAAFQQVNSALRRQGVVTGWGPRKNSWYLGEGLDNEMTNSARNKPVIVGTTFAEFAFGPGIAEKYQKTEEQCRALLHRKFADKAPQLEQLFRKAYPEKHITDLLSLDSFVRKPTLDYMDKRAAQCPAPSYTFVFAYDFPYEGGKPAWHCGEIPFIFHNADQVAICGEPGISDRLEREMAGAWVNFARCGDPNGAGLPQWLPYTTDCRATMVYDRESKSRIDYDTELIRFLFAEFPPFSPAGNQE